MLPALCVWGARGRKNKEIGFYCDASFQPSLCIRSQRCGRRWQTIIYLLMLCQKVSSIYHNLTFSDPSQVSQGPNKERDPQDTAYPAPKVKTRGSMKSPFSSWLMPQEISLHFLYIENIWLYRWLLNHRMPKGTKCEITPSRECLSRGSAYPPPPTLHP